MTQFLRSYEKSAPMMDPDTCLSTECASLGLSYFDIDDGSYSAVGNTIHAASGEETIWTDVRLDIAQVGDCVQINGSGVSIYDGEKKPFILLGELKPRLGAGSLRKIHFDRHGTTEFVSQYYFTAKASVNNNIAAKLNIFSENAKGTLRLY